MGKRQKNNYYINERLKDYPKEIADSLQYEANSYIYHYGDHFKISKEPFYYLIIKFLFFYFKNTCFFLNNIFRKSQNLPNRPNILCNAYFDLASYIKESVNVFEVPWENNSNNFFISDLELGSVIFKIKKKLNQKSLNKIFDPSFLILVNKYKFLFKNYLIKNNIKGIIFSIDISFFESLSISCAKEINIPTFLFLHGLPARYNSIDDNRTDFLIVWGNAIKNNYITKGVSRNKILVSGHPIYSKIKPQPLKSSLVNVLVLTKAMCGTPHSDMVRLMDRSNSLYYLELIMKLLKNFGVNNARLRCHPAENPLFYKKHLPNNFYKIDTDSMQKSIENSTLIIGPSSTMILDSIKEGINYILYEPLIEGKTLTGFDFVPPFNGGSFISITSCTESFKYNLNPENNIKWDLINDYINNEFSLNCFYDKLFNIN